MTAEILAIGTELLLGMISNTNAQYISSKLPGIGVNVYFHQVAGDNRRRLTDALDVALGRSDVVIVTGGLGPTMDDLTKEAVAERFGKKLVLDEESLSRIRERMLRYGNRAMAKNNERQAYFPEGAIILKNDHGTAPGCILEEGGKTVVMLPGPPSEMRPMFDAQVMPYLGKNAEYRLESRYLRVFGVGESRLEELIADLVEAQSNPTIATYAKEGEVAIRLTARYAIAGGAEADCGKTVPPAHDNGRDDPAPTDDDIAFLRSLETGVGAAPDVITPVANIIKERLGDALFGEDDEEPEYAALKALTESGLTLSLAESCTGGLIAARLTEIPGASEVFISSAVTYSNEAKMKLLGVRGETLKAYGAVSAQTACEMAEGARRASGSDIAVAVTGVAGPGGGSAEKPVGLVYLALSDKNGVRPREIRAQGSRARVRNAACLNAFDMIRRAARGLPWDG